MWISSLKFDDLTIDWFVTGQLQENAYLVHDRLKNAFLIDPGDDAPEILKAIQDQELSLQAILLTHAHFDHIGAVQPIREALKVPVHLHDADLTIFQNAALSAARWGLQVEQPAAPDARLNHGDVIQAGEIQLEVRFVPGHAPGHVVFVGSGFVLAGDTLFKGSIGRTDLPGGNHNLLLEKIRSELLTLPDEMVVLSGHGDKTTIGVERFRNPFLS
ncbi:MBL fold metallo-hydrolase [Deinococcus cellulosilyticus]|uniref:Hydrolase n=1 Tax=Deinococcus cellulosilyticus (strain DSM 18568 / NBRC 106333 / KACC 11606 / 5516J-15) TaxID=1223518 RepID=A0A511N7L9_DEIC1|nr:MBL fold metallo-hydrolase [Deinococcus cellulosilyticus]GEM48830.1 hydrolase [Deinococcus cellulosilyticus NBRC 106333 = KACC 11606]